MFVVDMVMVLSLCCMSIGRMCCLPTGVLCHLAGVLVDDASKCDGDEREQNLRMEIASD